MDLISIKNLRKAFGGLVAVDGMDIDVEEGTIYGLIGPNGAGKTTLIRCILGILKPTSGKVFFDGQDITGHRSWDIVNKGMIGTFQVVKPFRNLPIVSNVVVACLGPRAAKRGEWVRQVENKAMDALEFVGISDMALEPASVLSHGDLKRLEVARAIVTEPELLILDEPFGGLNPAETELMAKSVRRLHKGGRFGRLHSEGPAMLIIEHKLSELMRIVDRVIVINFGELIATGPPEEVMRHPTVVEAYTGKKEVL